MEIRDAVERILLGEPLRGVAAAHREELLVELGLDPDQVGSQEFQDDTRRFMNQLCRELGERHGEDSRVTASLAEWVRRVDDYDAFDALLEHCGGFEGRESLVRRGRQLFPGPLTAHWGDQA